MGAKAQRREGSDRPSFIVLNIGVLWHMQELNVNSPSHQEIEIETNPLQLRSQSAAAYKEPWPLQRELQAYLVEGERAEAALRPLLEAHAVFRSVLRDAVVISPAVLFDYHYGLFAEAADCLLSSASVLRDLLALIASTESAGTRLTKNTKKKFKRHQEEGF